MSWVKRGNHKYFYRSVRHGRRVKSVYFGEGPGAYLAAELAAEAAAERAERAARHAENRQVTKAVERWASPVAEAATAIHDA